VLFPQLSRLAARRDLSGLRDWSGTGVRQIALLLIPCAAATAVLATPLTRLIYQRGDFGPEDTKIVAEALFWFSFSLPSAGVNLMLTRTFFSLQKPWTPTALAGLTLAINTVVAVALYKPLGIGGIVIGTAVASAVMAVGQAAALRRELHGFQIGRTLDAMARMLIGAGAFAGAAYGAWWLLDQALGRGFLGQLVGVTTGLAAGALVYTGAVLIMRVPEAEQLLRLVRRRLGRRG
jgi:putative peptidoglycan lipid II flippase